MVILLICSKSRQYFWATIFKNLFGRYGRAVAILLDHKFTINETDLFFQSTTVRSILCLILAG